MIFRRKFYLPAFFILFSAACNNKPTPYPIHWSGQLKGKAFFVDDTNWMARHFIIVKVNKGKVVDIIGVKSPGLEANIPVDTNLKNYKKIDLSKNQWFADILLSLSNDGPTLDFKMGILDIGLQHVSDIWINSAYVISK